MNLPKPECRLGYTVFQIREIIGSFNIEKFWMWMEGQTMGFCNHEYPCAKKHGGIVYKHDLERFLQGLPVID